MMTRAAGDDGATVTGAGDLAEHSAAARRAMVDALQASGAVSDPTVFDVMGRVRREAFVPRFWSLPAPLRAGRPEDVREWAAEDKDALELVYDIDRALAIRRLPQAEGPTAGGGVTATASAPRVVASMLELLDLSAGMRVLEIGAGSGYNAALLKEMVGPDGSVTSLDIDAGLVMEAGERLASAGYGDVRVVAADGYYGYSDEAPFDRVVATVGCVDVAPAWLDQLRPDGFCLLPLQHDGWHPLTKVQRSLGRVSGAVVGRAGFVGIQGHQAGRSPWPNAGRLGPNLDVEWMPLPDELAGELGPEPGREMIGGPRMWDLAYFLALEDRRTAFMLGLVDGASSAAVDTTRGRIGCAGPHGVDLRDRLLEVAAVWMDLGRPSLRDYTNTFTALADGPERAGTMDMDRRQWTIDRIDFRQAIRLGGQP